MKILYYSSHPGLALNSHSGWGTHMREMIDAFRALGHEVYPVIMGGLDDGFDSGLAPTALQRGKSGIKRLAPGVLLESLRDAKLIRRDRGFEARLRTAVDAFRPEVIYERSHQFQLSGVRTANEAGIFHIMEFNTPYLDIRTSTSLMKREGARIESRQLEWTSRAVFVTDVLRKFLLGKHELSIPDARVAGNAVDPSKIAPDEAEVRRIRQLPVLQDRTTIGFVGAIFPWHRVDLLIDAAAEIAHRRTDFALLVVGDGSVVPELKRLVADHGLEAQTLFTGRVPHEEVFNYIAAMDIAVQPSADWYQSPIKLFEYGAMGKAVIAPDIEAVREVIRDKREGILTESSVEALSRNLEFLIDDRETRASMGAALHARILDRFTWDRVASRILEA